MAASLLGFGEVEKKKQQQQTRVTSKAAVKMGKTDNMTNITNFFFFFLNIRPCGPTLNSASRVNRPAICEEGGLFEQNSFFGHDSFY